MDVDQFWRTISVLNETSMWDMRQKEAHLRATLLERSPAEIVSFAAHFNQHLDCQDNWRLQSAASLLDVGRGDSGWHDFCATLIMFGRKAYWSANRHPDYLVDLLGDGRNPNLLEYEGFTYAIADAMEEMVPVELQVMPDSRPLELRSTPVEDHLLPRTFPRIWQFASARR